MKYTDADTKKNHSTLTRKLLALLLGIILTALSLEGLIRLGSRFLVVSVDEATSRVKNMSDILIVTTGDSHTQGIGAPEGCDYPSYLQKLLYKNYPGNAIQVINLGQAGSNSSEAVNRVLEFIAKSRKSPDIVIFQGGMNNDHNFHEAEFFKDLKFSDDRVEWSRYFLSMARVYRFSKITIQRLNREANRDTAKKMLHTDDYFDVHGEKEKSLLADWLLYDILRLNKEIMKHGGNLVLMNYWIHTPHVIAAYRRALENSPITYVNIFAFRYTNKPPVEYATHVKSFISYPDLHPNAQGYNLIANLLFQDLIKQNILPPFESIPSHLQ